MLKNQIKRIVTTNRYKPIFGILKRANPISPIFGLDRGTPIDRYYIEKFLEQNNKFIRGRALEIEDATYIRKFGGSQVTQIDILHANNDNPKATIVGDLTNAPQIQSNQFDCIIFTQTLQFIYEKQKAIQTLHRILKPGGTILATVSGISQISRYDMDRWGEYWRFTSLSARKLFEEVFPAENVCVKAHGNVLSAISFLHGLATEEIKKKKLDYHDPDYELLITIRATK